MMTVITTLTLRPESEAEWDGLIRERFRSAHGRPGWISGQLVSPDGAPHTRVLIGTWERRSDWESWHEDPAFLATRSRLDELQAQAHRVEWYDVVEHGHGVE